MIATLLAAAAMIWLTGSTISNLWLPLAICTISCALLWALSLYWQPNFLRGIATLVAFTPAFTLLMEAVAATGRPLVDSQLGSIDAMLGLNAADIVAWVAQYPRLSQAMQLIYFTTMPQTCLVMVANAEKPEMWVFIRRFILASQITLCLFYFFPAEGVETVISPPVAARFHELRAGAPLDLQQAQGIVTFPSFHTAWALIITASLWNSAWRWPAVVLNTLVITSTVTTGGHYVIDVLAGIVIAMVVILQPVQATSPASWLTSRWRRWRPSARVAA
jgi:membrane-associated phospholipid phosphatase